MDGASRHPTQDQLAEWLSQVREGSLQAFDRFYEQAAPLVMRLSLKWLTDRMEAEDVCHDVLTAVMSEPHKYDPARGSVEAWLAVLTRSRCLDRLRKRGRLVPGGGGPEWNERLPGAVEGTESRVLGKLEKEALRRAMRELPGVQRDALAAAFLGGHTQKELAEQWRVPVGTVKSRIRYGLTHLRKAMERMGWTEAEGGVRHD